MSAQVVLDGSLGPLGPRVGPNYVIPQSAGRLLGSNLFHSFSQFNVKQGESLTFTAQPDAAIDNVLARVTGGQASNVNGLLRSTVPGANLYVVNPAGIVFGPEAQLEVAGSFAATTADTVRLADGGRFDATPGAGPGASDPMLTTAAPQAFGFLAARPAAITYEGGGGSTGLAVADGAVLSLVGGDLRVTRGALRSVSGRVNLVAVASPGEVELDPASADAPLTLTGFSALAALELLDGSAVGVQEGGRAVLRGGSLNVSRSSASALAAQRPGGSIDAEFAGPVTLTNARVNSDTIGPAAGASVRIVGGSIVISGLSDDAQAPVSTNTIDAGAGGGVTLVARSGAIAFSQNASVTTFTSSGAPGGDITVTAEQGAVRIDGTGAGFITGLSADTLEGSDGPAGRISVTANLVEILRQGEITSTTRGNGPAGAITVTAGRMRVDGGNAPRLTGLQSRVADLEGVGATGTGGEITVVTAEALELVNGGVLSASTFGRGQGGNITVDAGGVKLGGSDPAVFTGIFARSTLPNRGGRGGSITVRAASVDVAGPAEISAISTGSGDAGDVSVEASGGVRLARGGAVTVQAGFDDPRDEFPDPATPPLSNAGGVRLAGRDITLRDKAVVSARARQDSGQVKVTAPGVIRLVDSSITAEAGRTGGLIDIDPRAVVLDRSVINGLAGGQDVRVAIVADVFLTSESRILTDTAVLPPEVDISGSLVRLNAGLASDAARLQDICGLRALADISSFVATGRGGTPPSPGGFAAEVRVVGSR